MSEYDDYVREHGFRPQMAGDPAPPKEPKPRCHVEGCERVVYKSVVCRRHWDAIPIQLRLQRATDAILAQQASGASTDLEIIGLAESMRDTAT